MVKVFHYDCNRSDRRDYMCDTSFCMDIPKLKRIVNDMVAKNGFIHVADVDTNDLDDAFRLTNNIESSWTENEGVTAHGIRLRSSMVGDIFELNGEKFVCASIGFEKL